jgi:hypothetical protein
MKRTIIDTVRGFVGVYDGPEPGGIAEKKSKQSVEEM